MSSKSKLDPTMYLEFELSNTDNIIALPIHKTYTTFIQGNFDNSKNHTNESLNSNYGIDTAVNQSIYNFEVDWGDRYHYNS